MTGSSLRAFLTRRRARGSMRRMATSATSPLDRNRREPNMRLTHFFIDRPRFAVVLSTFVTLLGLGALAVLPVAQYPEVGPPTAQVTTTYPGASAPTLPPTGATPP